MARPREFDELAVLDAAVQCFWARGYESTSIRDLVGTAGINGASLYNAFGDKRALYHRALDHYVDKSVADRLERCERLGSRRAISTFLSEIMERSLADPERKGCMLVNAAFDVAPHDAEFRLIVAAAFARIEAFFERCVAAGQSDGAIARAQSPRNLASHLLAVLVGLRVLARVRPERALLEGAVRSALTALDGA